MSAALIGGDEVNAIVVDLGTYQVKAGYAGEDTPKFVFPSAVGVGGKSIANDKDEDTSTAMDVDDKEDGNTAVRTLRVGTHAMSIPRHEMEVISPFSDGLLSDWEATEAVWDHVFQKQMRLNTEEHPLLLAEPSHNTKEAREKMVEIMFEKYKVPAVFIAKNAVLSSFSVARQTSLVVDVGHESATVAAVADGYLLSKSVTRSPLAGHLMTRCVQHIIEEKDIAVRPRFSFRKVDSGGGAWTVEDVKTPGITDSYRQYQVDAICQDVKHTICRVSDTPFDPEENSQIPTVSYELPDGQEIQVGADRFTVPEVMFNPSLLSRFGDVGKNVQPLGGAESLQSLPSVISDCISRCDIDLRRELYGGIVLTGGTALFSSLRDRIEKELAEGAPQMVKVKVTSPTNSVERRYSTWIGGSILASLGTFQQMWMSKQEYKESGAGLIHKKAP